MPAFIVVANGELAGRRLEVADQLTIGRENSDLTLPDAEASRHHAVLRSTSLGLEVEDLHSLNGTWVRGERIAAPVSLADGGELRIGTTTILVEVQAPEPPPTRISPVAAEPALPLPAAPRPSRRPASRLLLPEVVTFATIIATALALVVYFASR